MGAATALMEILVHQRQGLTILFPAVPEAWRETRFRGIRIPGPFRVSASLKAGRLARACISSLGGRTLTLASPRSAGLVESGRGGGRVLPFPLTLRFRPGETRIFTGAGSDSRI